MLTKGYVTVQDLELDRRWTDEEICDYFDTHPNVLIRDLAKMAGWSEGYVYSTLMKEETDD